MLKKGIIDINKVYLGSVERKKAYLGGDIVFDNSSPQAAYVVDVVINDFNEPLILPLIETGVYDGDIDWGDGVVETASYDNREHNYTSNGLKTVRITGLINGYQSGTLPTSQAQKYIEVKEFGGLIIGSNCFRNCSNLDITATDIPTIDVINETFRSCSSLVFNSSIGSWDTSNYSSAVGYVFNGASLFNQDITNWDTSGFTNWFRFLNGATSFNQDISKWDYSGATLFANAFGNVGLSPQNYSNLLNKWAYGDSVTGLGGLNFAQFTNPTISVNNVQYDSNGVTARAKLVSDGFIVIDGGLI